MPYHSVPGPSVCWTVRGACVNDTAAPCFSTPMPMNAHTHTSDYYQSWSNRAPVQQLGSYPCWHLCRRCIFLSGRKMDVNLKMLVLTCDYSDMRVCKQTGFYEIQGRGTLSVKNLIRLLQWKLSSLEFHSTSEVTSNHITLPLLHLSQTKLQNCR